MKNSLTKFKSLVLFSPINSFIFFLISIFSGFTNSLIALSLFPLLRELDENSIGDSFILNYFDNFMAFLNIEPNLITVLIFMLLIVMISSAIDIVFELFAQNTCANLRYSLSTKLFNKILDANWKFFREKKPGEIINSIFIEIQKSVASYKDILELMSFVSQFLFYVSFCFLISFYITSATIIVGLLIIVIFIGWNKKAKKAGYNYNLASKILTSEILDTLKNMKNIKASGRANLLLSFFIEDFVKLKNVLSVVWLWCEVRYLSLPFSSVKSAKSWTFQMVRLRCHASSLKALKISI